MVCVAYATLFCGLAAVIVAISAQAPPPMVPVELVEPVSYTVIRTSGKSKLYTIELPTNSTYQYAASPLLVDLHGSRTEIGFDYAALLHEETKFTFDTFLDTVIPKAEDQKILKKFLDYLWSEFLSQQTPEEFFEELEGMRQWHMENPSKADEETTDVVSRSFYTLANLPADGPNIMSMLEQELEKGWPVWLKDSVNTLISILEKIVKSCDAFGAWGTRTTGGLLFSSRNLDYNRDTGINKHKLITNYHIDDIPMYTTLGFSFGLGALAGMSSQGITVSEMNLDNSVVTFDGLAFPLRLRYVLEKATDLKSAMNVWDSTNNTNSFNFLIGSASDVLNKQPDGAYALETIMGFTGVFGANSDVERNSTYECKDEECHKWTNQTGEVHIGNPLPEAVWRTNHGMHPRVMRTQEPLFNNTVFRYDLFHDLFTGLQTAGVPIGDKEAVGIVSTLGIKGYNFLTCDQPLLGDNTLSVVYAPGNRNMTGANYGYLYVAWESGTGDAWRPAACSTYMRLNMDQWVAPSTDM